MTSLTLRQVLNDCSLVRPLGFPRSFPVSTRIITNWMRRQDTIFAISEGLAMYTYFHHRGDRVTDPEMRSIAAATMAVKLAGNYDIIDILDREEAKRPSFKRRLWNAEFEILQSI